MIKTPLTSAEKEVVEQELLKCFELNILPKKLECIQIIKKNPVLGRRSWTMVKGYVRSRLVAMKKKSTS